PCPRQLRQHHHAKRVRDEHEGDVDGVGGEEAVRLYTLTKLARENGARHRGGAADGGRGQPGEEPAPDGAPTGERITLHRCRATIASSGPSKSSTTSAVSSGAPTTAARASSPGPTVSWART